MRLLNPVCRRRWLVSSGATLWLASSGYGQTVRPVLEMEEGVSWALAEQRAATISDLQYQYRLTVPRGLETPVDGAVEVSFVWDDPFRHDVVLDFKDPAERVHSVHVNGRVVAWSTSFDHIVLPVDSLRAGSTNRVEVVFIAGDDALNRNEEFLYTLFVPDRAHFSLPLFDQPNLKARFSLELTVPDGWVAVTNGTVTDEPDLVVGGADRYVFRETQPIPTYLFAFAVGVFQIEEAERDGRVFRMFHRETDADKVARNRDVIFDLHAVALDWLEDYTQITYPFGKFDFVLIPPFQYGGMEHPGSIFYREASLLLDESVTQAAQLGRASLIAHETAHMWFGDLVTMNWFDDVWTKEVFANFMAAKIVHPSFPDVNHDLRFFLAHHGPAYGIDRTAGANPIRQPLENLREAGALYGPIIYQKAPIVMRQLERMTGEDAFRDGLREYLETFAYGNATWLDLVDILDRRSETDLRAWSEMWVDEPGRPDVVVERVDDATTLRLLVSQSDPAGRARRWPQALELLIVDGGNATRIPASLVGDQVEIVADDGRDAADFVLPNATGVEYGRFRLDPASSAFLMASLPEVDDALTRGIAWGTLWEGVLEGEVDPSQWVNLLLRGLVAETVEQNVQRLLSYLATTYWSFLDVSERLAVAPRVESTLWDGVLNSRAPTLKAAYFRAWRGIALTEDGVDRLRRIWAGDEEVPGVTLSEPDYVALAEGLAVRGVAAAGEILSEQATRIANPDRLARFNFVRSALSTDPNIREQFFDDLGDPANREREPWVLSALGYLHHPLRARHAQRFILPSLEILEDIQRTGDIFFPAGWLGATLGGHQSPEAAATVRNFLSGLAPAYPARLRAKILQSADMLFRAARVMAQ
ncbi:MAG: M1 family aminopeptidase [Acidobacteriota bacterium]|nr:M1 family aminopeptidase [Acidobacteriota bacterium]